MERSRARLLRAGNDEVEGCDLPPFNSKHFAIVLRLLLDVHLTNFVTVGARPQSFGLMVHGLARLGAAALTVAEFAIVLLAILALGATTLPGLVRARKR